MKTFKNILAIFAVSLLVSSCQLLSGLVSGGGGLLSGMMGAAGGGLNALSGMLLTEDGQFPYRIEAPAAPLNSQEMLYGIYPAPVDSESTQ